MPFRTSQRKVKNSIFPSFYSKKWLRKAPTLGVCVCVFFFAFQCFVFFLIFAFCCLSFHVSLCFLTLWSIKWGHRRRNVSQSERPCWHDAEEEAVGGPSLPLGIVKMTPREALRAVSEVSTQIYKFSAKASSSAYSLGKMLLKTGENAFFDQKSTTIFSLFLIFLFLFRSLSVYASKWLKYAVFAFQKCKKGRQKTRPPPNFRFLALNLRPWSLGAILRGAPVQDYLFPSQKCILFEIWSQIWLSKRFFEMVKKVVKKV